MSKVCHLSFIRGVPSDEDQAEDLLMQCHRLGKSSRREFLRGAAAIALTGRGFMSLGRPVLAYVGTYSSPQGPEGAIGRGQGIYLLDRKSTRLNSSHVRISYAVFCLRKKKQLS